MMIEKRGRRPLNKRGKEILEQKMSFTAPNHDWHPGDDLYPKTTDLNGQQPNGAVNASKTRIQKNVHKNKFVEPDIYRSTEI